MSRATLSHHPTGPSVPVYGSLDHDFFFRNASNIDDGFENGRLVYGVGISFTR